HPEWAEFRATEELDEREQMARSHDLQYIGLDGTVGIIANGAGLAMSTVDIVSQVGGDPANFLDIGGGANADVMANALEVINGDPKVRSIFINIFGGITRGEEVANGIVQALGRVSIEAPIVIRLDGTNADQGRAILAEHESDKLQSRPTMLEAARTAVELAGGTAK
ncbi:MAG TPA: succinate--CoA ligase subunit beta, partial [Acidimicrobiales bacterium]|nr:succinate--CoA ligase subunit beta [Acidimicrobiales bacterium]